MDLFGVLPDVIKPTKELLAKILRTFKEPVVRYVLARVLPDSFLSIVFRPVARKLEHLHIVLVRLEPLLDFLLGVIGGIVLDQVDPVTTAVEKGHHHLLQESQIGFPLKILFLV